MTDLPEGVRDLHQERVNTLRLLFAEVPENDVIRAVKQGTGIAAMRASAADVVWLQIEDAMEILQRFAKDLDPSGGGVPIGALRASTILSEVNALRGRLAGSRGIMLTSLEYTRR